MKVDNCEEACKAGLMLVIQPAGLMLGYENSARCMKDDQVRLTMGNSLLHEIMPSLHTTKEKAETLAYRLCGELENAEKAADLTDLNALFAKRKGFISLIRNYSDDRFAFPPGLTGGLACLIMLCTGLKKRDGRYTLLLNGTEKTLRSCPELEAFSLLACDMPPETLSYAALSDQALWGEDLRRIEGLEESVAQRLLDLQILGVRETMKRMNDAIKEQRE